MALALALRATATPAGPACAQHLPRKHSSWLGPNLSVLSIPTNVHDTEARARREVVHTSGITVIRAHGARTSAVMPEVACTPDPLWLSDARGVNIKILMFNH